MNLFCFFGQNQKSEINNDFDQRSYSPHRKIDKEGMIAVIVFWLRAWHSWAVLTLVLFPGAARNYLRKILRFLLQAVFICFTAQRNPTLLFELDGTQFKFSVKAPALDPLSQLPPRRRSSIVFAVIPAETVIYISVLCRNDANHINLFIQPVNNRPISFIFSAAVSYFFMLM